MIKFRAWIPQAKEWINDVDLKDLWESGRAFEDHGTSRYEAENVQGVRWKFDDLLFVQFTGLLDKAGREIYEGDVLGNDWGKYHVYWDRGGFVVRSEDGMRYNIGDFGCNAVEVIGNVHENPELVPGEREK